MTNRKDLDNMCFRVRLQDGRAFTRRANPTDIDSIVLTIIQGGFRLPLGDGEYDWYPPHMLKLVEIRTL